MNPYDASFKNIKISYEINNTQLQDSLKPIQIQIPQDNNIKEVEETTLLQKPIITKESLGDGKISLSLKQMISNTTEQLNAYTSKEEFFSPILSKLNIPITEQNINIASSLHNFKQALNHENISYVNSIVSKFQLKGETYINAVVLLLTYGNKLNKKNIEALNELSTGKNLFTSMKELSSIIASGKVDNIITSLISNNLEQIKTIDKNTKETISPNVSDKPLEVEKNINISQKLESKTLNKVIETDTKNVEKLEKVETIPQKIIENKEVKINNTQALNNFTKIEKQTNVIKEFINFGIDKTKFDVNISPKDNSLVIKDKVSQTEINLPIKSNINFDKPVFLEIEGKYYIINPKSNINEELPNIKTSNINIQENKSSENINNNSIFIIKDKTPIKFLELDLNKINDIDSIKPESIKVISEGNKQFIQFETLNLNQIKTLPISKDLFKEINLENIIKPLQTIKPKVNLQSETKPLQTIEPKVSLQNETKPLQTIEPKVSLQAENIPLQTTEPKVNLQVENIPLQTTEPKVNLQSETIPFENIPLQTIEPKVNLQVETKPLQTTEPKVSLQVETIPLQTIEPKVISQAETIPLQTIEPKVISQVETKPLQTIEPKVNLQIETIPLQTIEPKVILQVETIPLQTTEPKVNLQAETIPLQTTEPKVISQAETIPLQTTEPKVNLQTETIPLQTVEPKVSLQTETIPLQIIEPKVSLQVETNTPYVIVVDNKTNKINFVPLELNKEITPKENILTNDIKQSIDNIQINKPSLFNFNNEIVLVNKTPDNKIGFSPLSKQENIILEKPLQTIIDNQKFVAVPTKDNNVMFIPLIDNKDNLVYKDLSNLAEVKINEESNILIKNTQTNKVSLLSLEKNILEPFKTKINIALAKTDKTTYSIFVNNETISNPKLIDLPKTLNEDYKNFENPIKININNKDDKIQKVEKTEIIFSDPKTNKLYNIDSKNIELDNFPKLEKNVFIKDNKTEGFITLDKKTNTYLFINTSENIPNKKEIKEPLIANINNKENIVFTDDKNLTKYTPLLEIQPKFIKTIDKPMIVNYQNNDNLVLLDKRYNSLKLFSLDDNYFNQVPNFEKPIFSKIDNKNTLIINNDKINKAVSIDINTLVTRDIKTSEPFLVSIDDKQNLVLPNKVQAKIIPFDSNLSKNLITIKNPIEAKIDGKLVLIVPDNTNIQNNSNSQNFEHKIFDKKTSLPITKFDKFEQVIPIEFNNKISYLIKDPQDNKLKILDSKQEISNLGKDFTEPIKANINNKEYVIIPQNDNVFKVPLNETTFKKSNVIDKPLEVLINSEPSLLLPFKDNQTKLIPLDLDFLKRGVFLEKSIPVKINDISNLIINDEKHKEFKTIPFEQIEKKSIPINDIKEIIINNNEYILTPKENNKNFLIPKSDVQNYPQEFKEKIFNVTIDGKQNIIIPDKNNNLKTIPIETFINNSKEITIPIILDKTENSFKIAIPSINNEQAKVFNIKNTDVSVKEAINEPFTINIKNEEILVIPKDNKLQSIVLDKNNLSEIDYISNPLKINYKGNESLLVQNNDKPQIINISESKFKSFDVSKPVEVSLKSETSFIIKDSGEVKLFSLGKTENIEHRENFKELNLNFKTISKFEEIQTAKLQEINPISYSYISSNNSKNISEKNLTPEQLKIDNVNLNILQTNLSNFNNHIEKLLSVDILSDPQKFAQQIIMLKQVFGFMESELKILKQELDPYSQKTDNSNYGKPLGIIKELIKKPEDTIEENIRTKKTDSKNDKMSFDSLLNSLLSEISSHIDKISLNLQGRQLLSSNEKCFCIPLAIPFENLTFKGELLVREEDDNTKNSNGNKTLAITLSVETKNLDTILVDFISFDKDLQVSIKVKNQKIKQIFDEKINNLNEIFKNSKFKIKPVICSINPNQTRGNSILLPTNTFPKSLKRIDGVI